jgi:hypothetical protein
MTLKLTLCVLASIVIIGGSVRAQEAAVAKTRIDLAQLRLENVEIERESIGELFSVLSFAYNIPIGLEIARGGDQTSLYRIDFQKGTLADLMTQFVAHHDEYEWKIEDSVLNVFPKEEYSDPVIRELLVTEIARHFVSPEVRLGREPTVRPQLTLGMFSVADGNTRTLNAFASTVMREINHC